MIKDLLEQIDNLPPLPQTIIEIEEFRKNSKKDVDELLRIIEKDALIISTLLKVSNSAMFGFRSKIETPSKVINLLGIHFTIFIAINETVQNMLRTDLEPYEITSEEFREASNISSLFTNVWLSTINNEFKEELLLASLLQEVGKFILSELLIIKNKSNDFLKELKEGKEIGKLEKKYLGVTTSKATAEIFRHWKLSNNLIKIIEFVDEIDNCEEEYKLKSQILDVIKTVCNPRELFTESNIEKALIKADKYKLEKKPLVDAIIFVRNKVKNT